ncbi:forkhead box protein R1 [Rissa tridactyla]|uniref:forkhead box protein R1 n=1 Tax=Rissa tridactyla TaxID=75485 RepID=UPI0023BA68EF|nr:forkhead box protein R1 [Rissa tridactyla]
MHLSFQNKPFWESLHLKNGLEDWDMAEELKLTVTAERSLKGKGLKGTDWSWRSAPPVDLTEEEEASRVDIPVPQEMPETPEQQAMPMPWKSVVLRAQSVKLKRSRRTTPKIKGGWPRPPLNYCILITLALGNSASGSLTVQQIYHFTRQHFPFFKTAPEGWKSTIRHDPCFSSCFEKSTGFAFGEGNRKSCLWKLTPEGRRTFQEEAQALPEEALNLPRHSRSDPDLVGSLLGL